jgi:hypothetical protein
LAAQPTWEDLVPATNQISDKGLAVFAFAAYHQFQGGFTVREVVESMSQAADGRQAAGA